VRADSPWRRPDAREQRSLATRRRIYEAALEEFRREGFEAASIARIALRAGVSRPSFYFHFPTKPHVLLELQWVLENEVVGRIAGHGAPDEALHAFVDELLAVARRVGDDLFRALLQNWVRPPEPVEWDAMPVVGEVQRRFEQARAAGRLREGVPPERAMLLFLTGLFGFLIAVGAEADAVRDDLHGLVDLYLVSPSGSPVKRTPQPSGTL